MGWEKIVQKNDRLSCRGNDILWLGLVGAAMLFCYVKTRMAEEHSDGKIRRRLEIGGWPWQLGKSPSKGVNKKDNGKIVNWAFRRSYCQYYWSNYMICNTRYIINDKRNHNFYITRTNCFRPVPPDDHLLEARSFGWPFASVGILRMIIWKIPDPPGEHLQQQQKQQ